MRIIQILAYVVIMPLWIVGKFLGLIRSPKEFDLARFNSIQGFRQEE